MIHGVVGDGVCLIVVVAREELGTVANCTKITILGTLCVLLRVLLRNTRN